MSYITEYSELGKKEQRQLRYKRQYKEDRAQWDDSMVFLMNLLKDRMDQSCIILDAGCGKHNFVIDELVGSGIVFQDKIGLDVNKEATEGNTSVNSVIFCNLDSIPLPDSSVDVITSLWVLEHLENPTTVFNEIGRVLKPGGLFAFTTPNANSLLIKMRKLLNKELAEKIVYRLYGRKDEDTFEVYYRANTIANLQTQAGQSGFTPEVLIENSDPSYTSFDRITYTISKYLAIHGGRLFQPHIIGVWKKNISSSSKRPVVTI